MPNRGYLPLILLGAALLLIVSTAQLVVIATGKAPAFYEPPPENAAPKAGIE